jgi:hypothetical protein
VSVTERDAPNVGEPSPEGAAALRPLERALCEAGLFNVGCRAVTDADLNEAASTWAKRLGIPALRRAWVLLGRKPLGSHSEDPRSLVR